MHKSQSYWRLDKEKFLYVYIHFIRPLASVLDIYFIVQSIYFVIKMQISLKIDTRSIGLRQKIMKIEYIQFFFFFFFSFKLAYTNEEIKFKEQNEYIFFLV